ncbi:lamin tail domain-containing protein [Patescibacteria group bacterium]|nr:lamin tail domain-containing protein [Patescibacteria group bacterium]
MIIKEFLPNPVGLDKEGEYIKILNDTDNTVNLSGWKIKDTSDKVFSLSGEIKSKEEIILFYSKTKIILNNNGEEIFLFNSEGKLIDELIYNGKAEEGRIIMNQKIETYRKDFESVGVLNQEVLRPIKMVFFTDFLIAFILGLTMVYVILQLEKKRGENLF